MTTATIEAIAPIAPIGHNAPLAVDDATKANLRNAFEAAEAAEKKKRNARTRICGGLIKAHGVEIHFYLKNAKGDALVDEYAFVSDLMDKELFSELCGEGNKHRAFVLNTTIRALSGIDAPTAAQRDALAASLPVAFHTLQRCEEVLEARLDEAVNDKRNFAAQLAEATNERETNYAAMGLENSQKRIDTLTDMTGADLVTIQKSGALTVPYEAVHAAPKDGAAESVQEEYAARVGGTYTIDGANDNSSFNYLARKVTPPAARPNQPAPGVAGDTPFLAALRVMAKGNSERLLLATWFAALSTDEIFAVISTAAANSADRQD